MRGILNTMVHTEIVICYCGLMRGVLLIRGILNTVMPCLLFSIVAL